MKKSIAVILALILMMTTVFFGCGKKDEDENNTNTEETSASDVQGEQNESTDNGDQSVNGSAAAPEVSDTTEASTSAQQQGQPGEQTETTASTNPSKPAEQTATTNPTKPSQNNSQPSGDSGAYRIRKYQQIFESGTYKMTVLMEDEGLEEMPMTMAVKNGNIYISMNMDGIAAIMLYRADNDQMYMLLDFLKIYSDVTEEMMGDDLDFSEMTEQFKIGLSLADSIAVNDAKFNGKNVVCESYVKDGITSKYYFDSNDVLVGREDIDKDGNVDVTKFSDFSTTVEDSLFEIPDGYTYMNLSALMSLGS